MSLQVTSNQTQYAIKKRKRPQPRPKNETTDAPVKSNPSKRHRDRLNTELERLSELIPLPEDVVNKLDKLSILRLSVAYLRNKSYSQHMELEAKSNDSLLPVNKHQPQPTTELSETQLAMQALDGFIIVVTQDFNVFYITSSVQDCLGFPQSDVIYQSMLELIHTEDRKVFMKQMLINPMGPGAEKIPEDGDPPETPDYISHGLTPEVVAQLSKDGHFHRSFICRLRCLHDTSSGFLALHFTGHLALVPGQNRREKDGSVLPPELGLFLLASPLQTPSILEIRTKNYIFRTRHKLDYTPLGIDQKGRIVLGYTEQELCQQSGYQFIHSADMMHCADAHTKLMKHGQSGLTVFRLLHRANRWQWVTASARLIFNKGVPDYIISTHRPITEQEGEEHLKKRTIAFRFDFTGHASLYASVNPIGAGPPSSSKGPAEPQKQSTKRPRIGGEEVDPATLYGAQSFQSMNNYPEGLPNIRPSHETIPVVKAEDHFGNGTDFFTASPDSLLSHNSPTDSNTSPYNNGVSTNDGTSDSGFSDSDFQPSPGFNRILESLMENDEAPPLYHPPISQIDTSQYEPTTRYQQDSYLHTESRVPVRTAWIERQNEYAATQNGGSIPRQQMPPNQTFHQTPQQQMPPNQAFHQTPQQQMPAHQAFHQTPQRQMPPNQEWKIGTVAASRQYPTAHHQGHHQQIEMQQPLHHQYRQQQPHHQSYDYPVQQRKLQDTRTFPAGSATQNFMEQIHRSGSQNAYQDGARITAQPKHDASLLNSVEISSKVTTNANMREHKFLEDMVAMIGPANVSKDKFEISLECQENTVQFDLHKIATEYQTADPMSVIQDYVKRNPAQAIALATGNMPETKRNGGNGLHGHVQYQETQQPAYPNVQRNQKMMPNNFYQHDSMAAPHDLPNSTAPSSIKTEQRPEDIDFDLEEFLKFDIPNIDL